MGDVYAHSNACGAPPGRHRLSTFFLDGVDVLLPALRIKLLFPACALRHFPALFLSLPFHSLFLPFPEYSPPSPSAIMLFALDRS